MFDEKFFSVCRWFNIQLTTAFSIVTTIHWSVIVFLFFILLTSGTNAAWIIGIALLSVVPHEYGHALAARYYGIGTEKILIYPIGGVAFLQRMPEKPLHEAVVSIAGPLVSLALTLIGLLGLYLEGPTLLTMSGEGLTYAYDTASFWVALFVVNFGLTIFNLIPAFPMDGGRVLRASLACFLSPVRATQISYYVAVVMAIGMIAAGLALGSFNLVLIAVLIVFLANKEYEAIKSQTFRK